VRQSVRIGNVRGIAVGIHWSVVVIVALFAWELAEYQLPAHPGHAGVGDWVAGVAGAVVLLVSLFAHEVSHALVARHNDVKVKSITLFVFGGVTQLEGEAHTPGADFRVAVVGPATSVGLAAVFAGAKALAVLATARGLPVATLSWLWEINLVLAAFNMIPAAPLDGGRVLRAALWRHWGDRLRAAVAAARFGRGFGFVLIAAGVVGFFYGTITGLWAVLIGFFLYSAAVGEEQYARLQSALAGLTVRQVMAPTPPAVPGSSTVAELPTMFQWRYRGYVLVVTDDQGSLTGVITAREIRRVRAGQRLTTTASEVAIPLAEVPVADPDEPADVVIERIASHEGHPALVFDHAGHLAGVVNLADVERAADRAGRP
jgi:Zn-dependent protease/CBS domain-containing protein